MKDIFISFSSKETDEATRICDYLEQHGFNCFISTRDLIPGDEYASQLLNNMDQCKAVVLLLSKNSNESPHVLREVEYAVSHKIPILVYCLGTVVLSKSMEYFLMTHQWIKDGTDKDVQLLQGVDRILDLGTASEQKTAASVVMKGGSSDTKKIVKLILIIIAILILLALLVFGILAVSIGNRKAPLDPSHTSVASTETVIETEGSVSTACETTSRTHAYKVGDEVCFGSLYDTKIDWRVIRVNDDGTMILLASHILSMKSFDAPEGGELNSYHGNDYWKIKNADIDDINLLVQIRGNNDWCQSNIRAWLNSNQEKVIYMDQAPTYASVGANHYVDAKGFLCEFTESEQAALRAYTVSTAANALCEDAVDGIVSTEDKVFLLSTDELCWLDDAGLSRFTTPTVQCCEHDGYNAKYEDDCIALATKNYYWLLRDNTDGFICDINMVTVETMTDKPILNTYAGVSNYGIRPAICVDMDALAQIDSQIQMESNE